MQMGRNRLEAFSDGVIVIITTIMVLELKVPHSPDFQALLPLWPVFMSYVLSFAYVGIYWNKHGNMLRQIFDPTDLRAAFANWEEIAGDLLRHLHNEIAASPSDSRAKALLDEILAYPGGPSHRRHRELGSALAPVMTTTMQRGGVRLSFFFTVTVFGTPRDVTLAELHIESCFPSDAATAQFCENLITITGEA
jgi:hypothetical protein